MFSESPNKKYTSLLATGDYHGDIGVAKAEGPTSKIAIRRVRPSLSQYVSPVSLYGLLILN
jgi:hypothetical protein